MKIVFFGTADFAVDSLVALHAAGHQVVGVVTAADKPAGRGQQLRASAVKEAAIELGLPIFQPEKLKNEEFLEAMRALGADLFVVVAFRMMPEVLWAMPPLGTINLHGSLLPDYRGAAPIHWAVMNGEVETGVTTFFLKHEIDTGDLILQAREPIGTSDTTGDVYARLQKLGAALLVRTLATIEAGDAPSQPQSQAMAKHHAPKLTPENTGIDWNQPAETVRNFIRGLAPFPAAHAKLWGKHCKIYKASLVADYEGIGDAGLLATEGGKLLLVRCADAWLSIEDLQIEGKKRMPIRDLMNGWKPEGA